MDSKKQFSIEILNSFINIIITDVADKYLKKLKKDKKNPHKLIENYLDQAVFLTEQEVKILEFNKQNIDPMDSSVKNEFITLLHQDKEYEDLVKELNFAFNIIKHEELQFKVLNSLYDTFIELNKKENNKIEAKNESIIFSSVIKSKKFNHYKKMNNELNCFL